MLGSPFDSFMPHTCTIVTLGDPNPGNDGETRINQVTTTSSCHFTAENKLQLLKDGTWAQLQGTMLLPVNVPIPDPTSFVIINGIKYRPKLVSQTTFPWGGIAEQVIGLE